MPALIDWIRHTPVSWFVLNYGWVWPISESVHFCGLTLMTGTVGLFDLRLLGVGRGISPRSLHRLLRFGVAGFALSVMTGTLFIAGTPEQYFYNAAFKVKVTCLFLIGCNVILFYSLEFERVVQLGPDDDAPLAAKWMAGASLVLLTCVMCAGRMLTFFRPPF
jgi:Family of unknown function (DUF6644)